MSIMYVMKAEQCAVKNTCWVKEIFNSLSNMYIMPVVKRRRYKGIDLFATAQCITMAGHSDLD
jgi:hypothetical protein